MFEEAVKNCRLYQVTEAEIQEAEERMKVKFPADLRRFYQEYGYGFVNNEWRAPNRIMDPGSCAMLRLRESYYEFDPDLETYEEDEENAIIFFDSGDGIYMSIGFNDGKIYHGDEIIADTLEEFLEKIVDPDYWHDEDEEDDWDDDDEDEEDDWDDDDEDEEDDWDDDDEDEEDDWDDNEEDEH